MHIFINTGDFFLIGIGKTDCYKYNVLLSVHLTIAIAFVGGGGEAHTCKNV